MDYQKRVIVRNMTDISAYFVSVVTGHGGGRYDVEVPANGEVTLTTEEILYQLRVNNPLFVGYSNDPNKRGHHAQLWIEDDEIRREAKFEAEDGYTQEILTMQNVVDLFEIPRLTELKRALPHKIFTWTDRRLLNRAIAEGRITNHERVQIAQEFLLKT